MCHNTDRAALLSRIENMNASDRKRVAAIVDLVGDLKQWPNKYLEWFVSTHLLHEGRFHLTIFLLVNRCPPDRILGWFEARGLLANHMAKIDAENVIKQFFDGKFDNKYTTYVLPTYITTDISISTKGAKEMFEAGAKLVPHTYGNPVKDCACYKHCKFPVEAPTNITPQPINTTKTVQSIQIVPIDEEDTDLLKACWSAIDPEVSDLF